MLNNELACSSVRFWAVVFLFSKNSFLFSVVIFPKALSYYILYCIMLLLFILEIFKKAFSLNDLYLLNFSLLFLPFFSSVIFPDCQKVLILFVIKGPSGWVWAGFLPYSSEESFPSVDPNTEGLRASTECCGHSFRMCHWDKGQWAGWNQSPHFVMLERFSPRCPTLFPFLPQGTLWKGLIFLSLLRFIEPCLSSKPSDPFSQAQALTYNWSSHCSTLFLQDTLGVILSHSEWSEHSSGLQARRLRKCYINEELFDG